MNRCRYVVIYNLQHPCLGRNVDDINTLFSECLKEESSVLSQGVMVSLVETSSKAERLTNEINKSNLDMKACTLEFLMGKLEETPRECADIQQLDGKKYIGCLSRDNECFVLHHEKKFSLFENSMSGNIRELSKQTGFKRFVLSNTAKFVAFIGPYLTIRYGTALDLFYELLLDVEDVAFGEGDKYIVVHQKHLSSVWEMRTMKKIFETEATEIVLEESAGRFFVEKISSFVTFDGCTENPKYEIDQISVSRGKKAIVTRGRIPNIVFFFRDEVLQKNHPNATKISLSWSSSFLYVHKRVSRNSTLDFLECYGGGKILMYKAEDEIVDFKVSDNYAIVLDGRSFLIFLQRKRTLVEIKRIKKVNKVLLSMNRSGEVVAIYDNESDNIEFYGEGESLALHKHTYCTDLKWSQSGLFMASVSSGTNFAGLVQMFTCNGKLLWKKNFSIVAGLEWCPYKAIGKAEKDQVQRNYEDLVKSLPKDYLEYTVNEEDVVQLKASWLAFLSRKKLLSCG